MNSINNIKLATIFPIKLKDTVIRQVLLESKLQHLTENYSSEGGFNLPLTDDWLLLDLKNKDLLVYHNARQLRFIKENDYITGLRLKDDINYMTDEELSHIKNCIDDSVRFLI